MPTSSASSGAEPAAGTDRDDRAARADSAVQTDAAEPAFDMLYSHAERELGAALELLARAHAEREASVAARDDAVAERDRLAAECERLRAELTARPPSAGGPLGRIRRRWRSGKRA